MDQYEVEITGQNGYQLWIGVEADSEDSAINMAIKLLDKDDLGELGGGEYIYKVERK